MVYIIVKPTRREAEAKRQESLHREGLNPSRFRGTADSAEEAHDRQRELERQGEEFNRGWAISNDSPEAKQADADLARRFRTPFEWESKSRLGDK